VDPLEKLREIANREGVWLHVDGAYGGGKLLSLKWPGLAGLELADSVTIDPHKWFYAPLDAGAILVKDDTRLTSSFGIRPSYLTDEMDEKEERYQYYVHGLEQSRRFRGLNSMHPEAAERISFLSIPVDAPVSSAIRDASRGSQGGVGKPVREDVRKGGP
jgi:hypothetical protein